MTEVAQQASDRAREIGAIVALLRSAVIPADHIAAIAEEIGSALEVAKLVQSGRIADRRGELPLDALPEEDLARATAEVREWLLRGYDVRSIFDPGYPGNLHAVFNRPPMIFVRGQWVEESDCRAVSVVGTRNASPEGVRRAAKLARGLARHSITIVSGLAKGIDSAAHEAALEVEGRTVAVIGTGIDRLYPPESEGLQERILGAGGAVLSQFLPQQPPAKWTFPKRNVVMSGLSLATIVVEASVTSGARVQAYEALRHGRAVFLLRSLVETSDWAREYVERGKFGVRAKVLNDVDEVLLHLNLQDSSLPALTA